MNAFTKNPVKNLLMLILFANLLTSCVYYEEPYLKNGVDGYDGRAYVSLYWEVREPNYIDVDGIVPSNFYWNTYYNTSPGFYTVHYEYDYNNGKKIVTYAYDADVEVWVNSGERASGSRNGRDGADNYFELGLMPDGWFDYTVSSLKSDVDTLSNNTFIKAFTDSTVIDKGTFSLKVKYRKSEPRNRNK